MRYCSTPQRRSSGRPIASSSSSGPPRSPEPHWGRLLLRRCDAVLLVRDVLAPGHGTARVVRLLDGDVGHEVVRGRAVPVVLARLEEDAVAGADNLDLAATALTEPDAIGDVDVLAERMLMPGRP